MTFEEFGDETVVAPGSAGKSGVLRVVIGENDGSYIAEDLARVPFHLTRGMHNDPELDGMVFVYVQNPTGATVQGDRTTAEFVARAGSEGHVTTQSAEKIHRMHTNHASAEVGIRVEDDAYFEYVPDETILHGGARFSRETNLDVAPTGVAVVAETVVAGRLARDEEFDFEAYRSRLECRSDGELLFRDITDARPGTDDHRRTAVFDGAPVFGDLYVVAPDEDADVLRDAATEAVDDDRTGVTVLPNEAGVLVRATGQTADGVRDTIETAWDAARRELVGAPVPRRRKY